MSESALAFSNVTKAYDTFAAGTRFALKDVSFDVPPGNTVSVVGRSGSGKSTLLNLAAGIDLPTSGKVFWENREVSGLSDRERTVLRRDRIGLIFQFFHLLSHLSVRENIALPELIAGASPRTYASRIVELLERVGLADRADDPVDHLSGGEMQRVAICRALLRKPRLLLADEPTGNLDDATGKRVMELMLELAAEERSTLIYVTHSRDLAARAERRWYIHSGELEIA